MNKKKEFKTEESGLLQFDPIVIVRDVLKRWLVILMVTVLVGVGAYAVADIGYQPQYRTKTTLVVTSRGSSSTVYSNLVATSNLATVLTEMLNSSVFRQVILEETNLQRFDGSVSAAQVVDTNLLTMQVTASDPATAFVVTRAILNHYEKITSQVVGDVVLEVLQEPTVPTAASNPNNALGVMRKAMLITAVLCCVITGWRSGARNAIRSGKEARKKLECNYLGEIPNEKKYKTKKAALHRSSSSILLSNPATSFQFTEAIRKLRSRVEQHMGERKVLMVVSLLENEGKSTVAVNLAMALAKKHPRVLLIDCDLRKPACAKLLGEDWTELGVKDVLGGIADPEDLIREDSRSGLYMLLQKQSTSRSGDLISSLNMGRLIRWAREYFDYVILDMPPMAQVTDAESVMNVCDGTLLVVQQNAAPTKSLNKAIAALNQGKAKLIGCVLNNVHATFLSSGQGQGNTYGRYGRYGKYSHYGRYGKYSHYGKYGRYGRYGAYATNDFEKQD